MSKNAQILLENLIEQEFQGNESYGDISDYFEFFSASQILKNQGLSDDEIENGIVGKGLDGGCDSIYLFLNNLLITPDIVEHISAPKDSILELIIIQSKKTTSFGEDAIMKWKTVSSNLLDLSNTITDFSTRYNADVLEAFTTFRDTYTKLITSRIKLKFRFYYATLVNNRELQIVNPEIVNGLQTSMEVYNYFSENKEALEEEKRSILLRIIVPDNEESRDQIIFATNNQTNIPKATLRVTDPIHLQIEMYFKSRGLFYDRRKNYYKNQGRKPAEIVGVSFLAQCLITIFLKKPDYARARPSTLLNDEKTYQELYEKNNDLEVFYRVALLGKRIQKNVKSVSDYSPAEKSDILYYVLYAVIARVLNKRDIKPSDIKTLDLNSVTDSIIVDVRDRVYEIYKQHGGNGRVAKSAEFIQYINAILEE